MQPHTTLRFKLVLRKITVILILMFVLGSASTIFAQTIRCEVKTVLHTLPLEKQEWLRDFHERIQNYINGRDWHDKNYGGEIYLSMEFVLRDNSTASEERYSTNLIVSNGVDIQYFDKRCRFKYRHGELISVDNIDQNSLTNLIDFYVYLVLGGEFDKIGTLEGTPFFEKAKMVAEQARFGLGRFIDGWDLRFRLVERHLSDEHKPFRQMLDYYFYGLYLYGDDDNNARKYCAIAIDMIVEILTNDPENDACVKFLDAHRRELITVFKGSKDEHVLSKLADVDPDHAQAYIVNND